MTTYTELLAELRSKWLFPCNIEAADLIERLIRERDEARAKAIEEAVAVCDQCPDSHWGPWIRKHILQLKDKP
jgi:hypothetical protein